MPVKIIQHNLTSRKRWKYAVNIFLVKADSHTCGLNKIKFASIRIYLAEEIGLVECSP